MGLQQPHGMRAVSYTHLDVYKRQNVICQNGTPAAGKAVYIRTKKNESFPNAVVGGFEAAEDTTNSVKLSNVQWKGMADANGVAELRILTIQNA